MNHGGIAYITDNRIHLSEDLLMPLFVTEGTPLSGLYYPTPDTYQTVQKHPDLVLTPIPIWAWPRSAGLRLELKHEAGALSFVAGYLKDKNLNILMSQCTRAGHRYATWNLVVEFEELKGQATNELATSVPEKVAILAEDIQEDCSSALQPRDSPELRHPVGAWALRCLNHFYRYSEEHPEHLFTAQCLAGHVVNIGDAANIEAWGELKSSLPAVGFASLDTENFTLRVVVLRNNELERFRSISFRCKQGRRGRPGISSRGVLHSVTDVLKQDWNMWHMHTECRQSLSDIEEYGIYMVVESVDKARSDDETVHALGDAIKRHQNMNLEGRPIVASISPLRIFISIRNQEAFPRRDAVEKYCRIAATENGILPGNLVFVHDHISDSTTKKVTREIENCHGMLQFFMGPAENPLMDWLNAEFFLASYLDIPRVRVIDEALREKITFERDRSHWSFSLHSSDHQIEEVTKKAFQELVEDMRKRHA